MREDFTFPSHDGITQIHAIRWTPESGEVRAVLQITHGMIEHIERYEPFALYLVEKGFVVTGHDHIGHGSSVRSKEDWGYFADENAGEILIEDMHSLRQLTQEKYPGIPYFMLGHSMGSFLLHQRRDHYGQRLYKAQVICAGDSDREWVREDLRLEAPQQNGDLPGFPQKPEIRYDR